MHHVHDGSLGRSSTSGKILWAPMAYGRSASGKAPIGLVCDLHWLGNFPLKHLPTEASVDF